MQISEINKELIKSEIDYSTSRSGGKGGQHVNKTETKVHLYFDVENSQHLTEEQKKTIIEKAGSYLSTEGVLQMTCDSGRSQAANKQEVKEKFFEYLDKILKPKKNRKKTKIPHKEKKKRLEEKQKQSEKKDLRKPPELD